MQLHASEAYPFPQNFGLRMYPPASEKEALGPIPADPIVSPLSRSSMSHTKWLMVDGIPRKSSAAGSMNASVSSRRPVHLNDMYFVAIGSLAYTSNASLESPSSTA